MIDLDTLFRLDGKTALVTGGATGIGRMLAEVLVQSGARVLLASRNGEDCARAAAEINSMGLPGSAVGFAGDVATAAGVAALAGEVAARCEALHILVNSAGKTWGAPLDTFPHSAWESVMAVNVAGLFELTRALLPLLRAGASHEDPARIVNLGSSAGLQPCGDGAYSYSASKAAVHHLTQILAKELAGDRITVNAFAPGPFPSRMTAFATADAGDRDLLAGEIPLGRIGRPDDLAAPLLYLCGRGGAHTTGAIIPIDGGLSVDAGRDIYVHTR